MCEKRCAAKMPQRRSSTRWSSFAEYAFNKSHAAAYAVLAYETGYLKVHYPAEFMAAADDQCDRGCQFDIKIHEKLPGDGDPGTASLM